MDIWNFLIITVCVTHTHTLAPVNGKFGVEEWTYIREISAQGVNCVEWKTKQPLTK